MLPRRRLPVFAELNATSFIIAASRKPAVMSLSQCPVLWKVFLHFHVGAGSSAIAKSPDRQITKSPNRHSTISRVVPTFVSA